MLASAIDRYADADAVFPTDTGRSTLWLARFVRMSGTRRLIGSDNLGSMATRCRRPPVRPAWTARAR